MFTTKQATATATANKPDFDHGAQNHDNNKNNMLDYMTQIVVMANIIHSVKIIRAITLVIQCLLICSCVIQKFKLKLE